MADYTQDDLKIGDRLVSDLLTGIRVTDLEDGITIADVEYDAVLFLVEVEAFQRLGRSLPAMAVADGPPVPVSLSAINWPPGQGSFARPLTTPRVALSREYRNRIRILLLEAGPVFRGLPRLSPLEARANFLTRAGEFLATRLSALSSGMPGPPLPPRSVPRYLGGPPTTVAGCHFSVNTKTSGLTAHWSGAYYIAPNYLGAPTTPAVGVLRAGTYVFGVSGGTYGSGVRWDKSAICTLPGVPSVYLHF
jgi:hypothetical protein